MTLTAESQLSELHARSTVVFERAFVNAARAIVSREMGESPSSHAVARSMDRLEATIVETMILADLTGREMLFVEYDAAVSRMKPSELFAARSASPVVPDVPFREAYEGMMQREPRLAPSMKEVAEVYRDRQGFALARSAELSITRRIRDFIASAIKKGIRTPNAAAVVEGIGEFSRSYAQTVYETNLTTAYNAGRFQQAQDEGVRVALPAMERFSIVDSAVRRGRKEDHGENHRAAHGFVADTRDPVWRRLAPPSGYRCRCGTRLVPVAELRRRGLIDGNRVRQHVPTGFEKFSPHPNFGNASPAALVYG